MKLIKSIAIKTILLALKNYINFNFWELDPPAIIWQITHKCSFTCRHCSLHFDNNNLSDEELIVIAKKIALSSTPLIAITGGEPLILRNIKEIIKILKASNKFVSLNTNGYILREFADFLIEENVDSISISLDAPNKELHNYIRGNSLAFDKVIDAIQYIMSNRKENRPIIELIYTINKENFHLINEFYKIFSKKVDKLTFQPINDLIMILIPTDKKLLFDPNDMLTKKDLELAIAQLNKRVKRKFHSDIINFVYNQESYKKTIINHCIPKMSNYMSVLNNGDCFICGYVYGNLLKQEVKETWNNKYRETIIYNFAKTSVCNNACLLQCNYFDNNHIGYLIKQYLGIFRGKVKK